MSLGDGCKGCCGCGEPDKKEEGSEEGTVEPVEEETDKE